MFVYVYSTYNHIHIHKQDTGAQADEGNDCGRRVINVETYIHICVFLYVYVYIHTYMCSYTYILHILIYICKQDTAA